MHFIGFSLGAHVSGVAGQVLFRNFNVRAGRITGLDPAGPNFDGSGGTWADDRFYSLDKYDAHYVDVTHTHVLKLNYINFLLIQFIFYHMQVIHCNMGTPLSWLAATIIGKYGTWVQRGDVDFYRNLIFKVGKKFM